MLPKTAATYILFCVVLSSQFIFATAANQKPAQAQNPIGHWKFDEASGSSAYDSSGNGHIALLSDKLHWVSRAHVWAISANASNKDAVTIPPIDLRRSHAVSVSLWVNRKYTTDGRSVLLEASSNYQDSTTGFVVLPDDETCHGIRAALRGNEGTTANCYSQPSSGVWHHLTVVYDKNQTGGDEVSLYIDGVQQNPTWNLASATNTNNFGKDPIYLFSRAGSSLFSSGTIKDLQIYNRPLQREEIQQIYNGAQQLTLSPAISYVQGNYATPQNPQTTVNVTYNAAQTAGDLNVVVVGWNDNTSTISRVADSKGNAYTPAVGPTIQNGYATQSIYYAKNIVSAGARTNTVSVTFSTAAAYPDIRILEYNGADLTHPLDVTAANIGNSSTSNSGSASTTNATDLILGANLTQTMTASPGSGFTKRLLTQPDGDIAEDHMVSSTGSYSATAPISPSGPWIMQMVAFRTAATMPSFTITASPASLTIAQNYQGTSTITTTASGGFNSSVTLSASGMPSGATVSFNPTTIPPPGTGNSTMTITVGSNTSTGTYPITVKGSGGGVQQSTTVTLTVIGPAGFTISASPSSLTVPQGNQGTSTITTTAIGGFDSSITLSASGMPSGATVSFNPTTIPPPGTGNSTMTITVGSTTPTGTYPITVKGSGGGVQQSTTVTLTVIGPAGFTISASPSSLTVPQGNQGTSTITTTAIGGFDSSITLSASGMPSRATVSFNPTTIPAPGSGTSTMTITVGSTTPTGTYPITVTGNGGGAQQSTTVMLTVTTRTQATPTLVQHVTCPNSGGIGGGSGGYTSPTPSYICPLAEATQAGNTLVLGFFSDNSGDPTWTVSDDKSNTWTLAQSTTDNNGNIIAVYYALNVAAGTRMITVKNSGGTAGYLAVSESEYYNVAASSALDAGNCNAGSRSTSITAGNITPTASGDLLWQYAANADAAAVSPFIAGSQSNITWALDGADILTGDATQAGAYNSTSTISPTFASGTTEAWDSCVMALKAASAGNPPSQPFRILHMLHAQLPATASSPFAIQMPTSGNLIVVSFISGGTTISNMTSTPSNAWSSTGNALVYGQTATQIYYAANANTSNSMNITFTLDNGMTGSTFMIYDITGAATSPFDVDSGGQYGDQASIVDTLTTCTNCLTPSVSNDLVVGNFGQEWCTATAIDIPNGGLFDAATYDGNSINGPEPVDQNNGWFHYYDSGVSPLSATWTESCGSDAQAHWSGRLATFKKAQ